MIPKKIHYCWLSNDPIPTKLQRCIDSWKKYMPDYEIIKWDLNRFPLNKSNWVRQAFETKKYAFAADYIRLYALVTEGGIYLDSDVEVLKSFDDLLNLPYFICKENSPEGFEAATIGAEVGCKWIQLCYEQYEGKDFINSDGSFNMKVLPTMIWNIVKTKYELVQVTNISEVILDENNIYYLPYYFFSPKSYVTKKMMLSECTYSIHHFAGTWLPWWKKMLLCLWVPLKVKFPNLTNLVR